jgi:hypothetical protein
MIARFHTICHRCRREIRPGQHIIIPKAGRAVHAACGIKPAGGNENSESKPGALRAEPELLQAKLDRCEKSGFR